MRRYEGDGLTVESEPGPSASQPEASSTTEEEPWERTCLECRISFGLEIEIIGLIARSWLFGGMTDDSHGRFFSRTHESVQSPGKSTKRVNSRQFTAASEQAHLQ